MMVVREDGYPNPIHHLLNHGLRQARLSDLLVNPLDTSTPLLHNPRFTENPCQYQIS